MLKYNVRFDLRKNRKSKSSDANSGYYILMIVTWNGQRLYYSTGHQVTSEKWRTQSIEGQKISMVSRNYINPDGYTASQINSHLDKLRTIVNELFIRYKSYPTLKELREDIDKNIFGKKAHEKVITVLGAFDLFIDARKDHLSEGRIRHYRSLRNFMQKFLKSKDTNIKYFSQESLRRFETWIRTYSDNTEKTKTNPDKPKKTKIRSANTVASKMKLLRALFNYAEKENWTKENPFTDYTIIQEKYGDPIFLTKQERNDLYLFQPKKVHLERIRDRFILQCHLGCRVGDFSSLTHNNIHNDFLTYVPGKGTKNSVKTVSVPLTETAKEIINKYDIPGGFLVPPITEQKYNEYLKDLFKEAGLDRPVVRYNEVTRTSDVLPLYQLASSHMARRTFVGILHKTVKNEVIASMTGHVENSRAFRRYYQVDNEDRKNAIKNL